MKENDQTTRIVKSLLAKAKLNDKEAIATMFRQFIMPEEKLFFAEYLGVEGIWGIGRHSFACLTDRRIATLRVGAFGEVLYQDGLLEYINSTVVYQPSKLILYLMWIVIWGAYGFIVVSGLLSGVLLTWLLAVVAGGLAVVLLMIMAARLYYRIQKCGAVWWIREGVSVYAFSNRKSLVRVNALTRIAVPLRDLLATHAGLADPT